MLFMFSIYVDGVSAMEESITMTVSKLSNGTYSVRIRFTNNLGKRQEKKKSGFKSKTLANAWERQTLLDIDNGKFDVMGDKTTIDELVSSWLEEYRRGRREVTVAKVKRFFDMYVLTTKWFKGTQVRQLTKRAAQQWVNDLASQHSTYKKQVGYFKRVIELGVSLEFIEENPFSSIRYPDAIAKPTHEGRVDFYDRAQLQKFIDVIETKYNTPETIHKQAYLRTLAMTGMRNGELRAITWSDIHLDSARPYIDVNKTMSEVTGHGIVIDKPKTDAGIRTVYIDDKTRQLLIRWRAVQGQRLMRRGMPADVVWTNQRLSGRISSNQPREWLLSAIKGTDVPRINIHGLRHTYITLAVQSGMAIKTLQAQVGHDDINTTLNVYTAVTADMRATTVDTFTSLVNF